MRNANCQLAEAKKRGATKAVLVFCCQFPLQEKQLRKDTPEPRKDQLLNIDHIYFKYQNECFQV